MLQLFCRLPPLIISICYSSKCRCVVSISVCICVSNMTNLNRAHYIRSKRGGNLLYHNGYQFRVNKKSPDGRTVYYRCARGCPAKATVRDNFVVSTSATHTENHLPDYSKVIRKNLSSKFLQKAQTNKFHTISQVLGLNDLFRPFSS